MPILQMLEQFLFEVSNVLYLPVIAAVSALVIYVALTLGALAHEAWERRRLARSVATYEARLALELAAATPHLDVRLETLLQGAELDVARSLDRVRFVIKVGPALGLMGTLIPMGISLAALAEGNIPKMAGSMVTAFTAKWLRDDIRRMEFLTEVAAREHGCISAEGGHALSEAA